MGSEHVWFRLDPEAVTLLTGKFGWNLLAHRVFMDPVTRLHGPNDTVVDA